MENHEISILVDSTIPMKEQLRIGIWLEQSTRVLKFDNPHQFPYYVAKTRTNASILMCVN